MGSIPGTAGEILKKKNPTMKGCLEAFNERNSAGTEGM